MASDQIEERPGFSGLLAELNDSDVVIEVGASSGYPPATGSCIDFNSCGRPWKLRTGRWPDRPG